MASATVYSKRRFSVREWTPRLKELIPSYGRLVADDAELCRHVRGETAAALRILEPAGQVEVG